MSTCLFGLALLAVVVLGLWVDKRYGSYRDRDPRPQDTPDTRFHIRGGGGSV